jgi:hypothetical protein
MKKIFNLFYERKKLTVLFFLPTVFTLKKSRRYGKLFLRGGAPPQKTQARTGNPREMKGRIRP